MAAHATHSRAGLDAATKFLGSLREGDVVYLTHDGKRSKVTVQQALRGDTDVPGPVEHHRVTIGYGPGRWNREVTVSNIVTGAVGIEVVERERGQAQRYRPGVAHERMAAGNCPECGHAPEAHGTDPRFWLPNPINCSLLERGVRDRIAQYVKDNEEARA